MPYLCALEPLTGVWTGEPTLLDVEGADGVEDPLLRGEGAHKLFCSTGLCRLALAIECECNVLDWGGVRVLIGWWKILLCM